MPNGTTFEAGRYLVRIDKQGFSEASTETPQFFLQFTIGGKINPMDPQGDLLPCPQVQRTWFRAITEKTMEFFTDELKQLGFEGSKLSELDSASPSYHSFEGAEVEMFCKIEQYNGKPVERWNLARDGAAPEPLEAKKVRQLDALFGKYLRASGAKPAVAPAAPPARTPSARRSAPAAPVPPQPAVAAAEGISDDDVPF